MSKDLEVRDVGRYLHYKGNEYLFISEGVDNETGDMVIIYKSLHDGTLWCRPYEMFHDWVTSNGKVCKKKVSGCIRRFELLESLPSKDVNISQIDNATIRHSETGMIYSCKISRRGNPKLNLIDSDIGNKIRPILSGD